MNHHIISTCHSLKIIPLSKITRFARIGSKVIMQTEEPDNACAIPGSIKVAHSTDDGVISKKITFERRDVSVNTADTLNRYKASRLVAIYVDEAGNLKVAGSPDYPLSLDYTTGDGVFHITLQGKDTAQDAFLTD